MTDLRSLHQINACLLGIFIAAHLGNHLVLALGADAHIAVMSAFRTVYRAKFVEAAIIFQFVAQMGLGLALLRRRGRPRERWAWVQALSGAYLIFFLAQHIAAVFWVRSAFAPLDTNIYWAAAVAQRPPLSLYFIPYYGFAILSVFAHLAAAIRFRSPQSTSTLAPRLVIGAGALAAAVILAGLKRPMDLPLPYQMFLKSMEGGDE
jgi:hypothetical protein